MDDLPCQDNVNSQNHQHKKQCESQRHSYQMICKRQQQYPNDKTDNCQTSGHRLVCVIAFAKGTEKHASDVMPCYEKGADDKGEARTDFLRSTERIRVVLHAWTFGDLETEH